MRNDLSVLAAGTALREIYIVYARLRNALRILVRIQLSGIAEFAINRSPPEPEKLPRKATPLIDGSLNENLSESNWPHHLYEKSVFRQLGLFPSCRDPGSMQQCQGRTADRFRYSDLSLPIQCRLVNWGKAHSFGEGA